MQKDKLSVLVVGDDRMCTLDMKKAMEFSGMVGHCVFCSTGREALDYLRLAMQAGRLLPDLILVDINIASRNDNEFFEDYARLKENISKSVRLYLITSLADTPDAVEKHFSFIRGCLVTPILKEKFTQILQQLGSG